MRHVACLAAVLSVAVVVGLVAAGRLRDQQAFVAPMVAGERVFDFGEQVIESPVKLEHVFVLVNGSDAALRIQKIATSCGCTDARASLQEVPAGASFEVAASLKLSAAGPEARADTSGV